MKIMRVIRALRNATSAALVTATIVAPTAAAAASHPDAWVTTKAKIALLTTDGVSGTAINVDTVNGRVTLHGKVTSEAEKAKAADVVGKIDGAREVRNLLQIVPPEKQAAVSATDEEVRTRVTRAFESDPTLESSGIAVQSVNQGVVLLGGETPSMTTHLRAVATAAAIPGVRRVATEVEGGETLADAEPGQTATGDRTAGAGGATGTVSDAWITSAAKLRLLANSATPALDINVDTRGGVVTLFGMVPTREAKTAAEQEAAKVSGVKRVVNELQVVASARQEAVAAQDDDIEQAVEKALEARQTLTGEDVSVEVKDGVVRLTGSVPSETARVTAATTARAIPGVRAVLWEDLKIGSAAR
jgi:osmotically-inducible protein OsmY